MEFKYNKEYSTYFQTKKLVDGYVARIYFENIGRFYKRFDNKPMYNIALAISKSKKDLNNWVFEIGKTKVNDISQYSKFGITVLMWAKKMIELFSEKYTNKVLIISSSNFRRYNIYKKKLADFSESSYDNTKILYKIL